MCHILTSTTEKIFRQNVPEHGQQGTGKPFLNKSSKKLKVVPFLRGLGRIGVRGLRTKCWYPLQLTSNLSRLF